MNMRLEHSLALSDAMSVPRQNVAFLLRSPRYVALHTFLIHQETRVHLSASFAQNKAHKHHKRKKSERSDCMHHFESPRA